MKRIFYPLTIVLFTAAASWIVYVSTNDRHAGYKQRLQSQLDPTETMSSGAPAHFEAAMEYYRLKAANVESGLIETSDYQMVLDQIKNMPQRRLNKPITWQFAGPDNVGGRTRAYIIDRTNPNTHFAGAVSGGLFRSNNKGLSWTAVNPMQENLNISCMTQTKNNVIYYGTGEGGFVSVSGTKDGTPGFAAGGIFMSEDGGQTFTIMPGTQTLSFTSSLAADSLNPNRLWAGTNLGLRYTDDKGVTWNNIPGTGNCRDIQIASDGTIYAYYAANGIVRSTNGGTSFENLTVPFTSALARLRIAISPQDPNYVYLVTAIAGRTHMEGLYRSTDKGNTFQLIQPGGSIMFNPLSQVLTLQGQGNFDICLTVDPENKDRVIIGGVQLAEWDNGSAKMIASLAQFPQNPNYVHADKHDFLWDYTTSPPTLIVLTDGGMFYSPDKGVTFIEKTRNYSTTQFYGLAANRRGQIIGGTQDNGTLFVTGSGNSPRSSVRVLGGDGFQNEISRLNDNVIFAESQYGNLRRSVNGGVTFLPIWDNRLTGEGAGQVRSPLFADFDAQFNLWENDQTGEGRFFFCTRADLWMATDVLRTSDMPSWFMIAPGTALGGGRFIDIEVSKDGGSVFVCKGSNLFRVDGLHLAKFDTLSLPNPTQVDPNITVTNIGVNLPNGSRVITSINIDPNNPNRALVTVGNFGANQYVYLSENILDPQPTFVSVHGNLPRFPVYDAIISYQNPNYFVVTTEFGVWATENGGSSWVEQNEGMARVATYIIRQYQWNEWEGPQVYIGTHGAGFFRSTSLLTNVKNVAKSGTEKAMSMTVYPNPAKDEAILSIDTKKPISGAVITVMDMSGRVIRTLPIRDIQVGQMKQKIDLTGLKTGHYLIQVKGNHISETSRISVFH
jgi:hypothetical protein